MDLDYVVMPTVILAVGILVIWLSVRRMRSVSTGNAGRARRITERVILGLLVVLATVLAGSSAFNAISLQISRYSNPPQGSFYTVNGAQMHLHCMGTGAPTLVLDAGFGNDASIWDKVQPELAKTTQVCSYDRAGMGWSDSQPGPRDADQIVAQEHDLLAAAHVTGPIVLMGHSIAGLYVRDYATHYPENVVGIVFVDGSSPAQFHMPEFTSELGHQPWHLFRDSCILGVPRLMWMLSIPSQFLDAHAGSAEAEARFHTHIPSLAHEMGSFGKSGDEVGKTGPYGALPILIFSQDTDHTASQGMDKLAPAWNQMQEALKKLSTRSRRIIAKGSGHYIFIDRKDLIEKEVPLFIEQVRGTSPEPTNYGSTVTE